MHGLEYFALAESLIGFAVIVWLAVQDFKDYKESKDASVSKFRRSRR